jgi:hypothetical protein
VSAIVELRLRVLAVAIAPVLLLIGFLIRPHLSNPRLASVNAEAVTTGANRWLWGHLVVALGLVALVLGILAIRFWLSAAGENIWSFAAVAFVATGAAGLIFVVGYDGLGGWAVAEAGLDAEQFFESGRVIEGIVFTISAVLHDIGLIALAIAVARAGVLSPLATRVVVGAVIVAVLVPILPSGWAVYALSLAALVASWPIAWRMLRDGTLLEAA